jgi:hypothetical protein
MPSHASDGVAEPMLVMVQSHCRGDLTVAQCCCRVMLCDRSWDLQSGP